MRILGFLLILSGLLAAVPGSADTVYLKNGVRFDGTAQPIPDKEGLIRVSAGNRTLIYRATEIERVEKNARTGHLDREALVARWQEKDRQLTEATGLTAEQRRQVRGLMFQLKTDNVAERLSIRERLVYMQADVDVYGYLLTQFPELSILLAPNVLEVMFYLDNIRSVELLRQSTQSTFHGTRAMAIDLLGRVGDTHSIGLIARGLVDHRQPVQLVAAAVLAQWGIKEATPALIGTLTAPDQRVSNQARTALVSIWAGQLEGTTPDTVDEWKKFWSAQTVAEPPIELAGLVPLIPPEEEVTQSIDGNY